MAVTTHSHPVDASGVDRAQAAVLSTTEAERLASLLGVLADPIRVRMVFALASVGELCVGDLALALGISMDQSSYALKQLRGAGVVGAAATAGSSTTDWPKASHTDCSSTACTSC